MSVWGELFSFFYFWNFVSFAKRISSSTLFASMFRCTKHFLNTKKECFYIVQYPVR